MMNSDNIFEMYAELIVESDYINDSKLDRFTNIINAMVKTSILKCKEINFKYKYKDFKQWEKTAKIFNENVENCKYHIFIDEETIVCSPTFNI